MPYCSPTDQNEDYLKRILMAESGCLDSCSGLHADVVHRDDKFVQSTSTSLQHVAELLSTGELLGEENVLMIFLYSVLERGDHGMEGQTKWIPILDSIKKQSEDQRSVRDELLQPMKAYNAYKTGYMKNIQFDNDAKNQCKCNDRDHSKLFNHVS